MRCPRCGDEYRSGVTTCASCDVALIATDAPAPPQVDALLGTFHPAAADEVVALLEHRRITHERTVPVEEDRVEILVDRAWRDDLRAELVITWPDLLARMPHDTMYAVIGGGGPQPGWFDAPSGSWVDHAGRLRVDRGPDESAEDDARRVVGPTLTVLGAVLAVFGWWPGDSEVAVVGGVSLVLLGVFLPR